MSLIELIVPPVTERQTMALAGVAQAVKLITDLAETGQCDRAVYLRNLSALLALEPEDNSEVFGESDEMRTGLITLQQLFATKTQSRKMRYLAQLLYLQKRLMKRPDMLNAIADGIRQANRQTEFYGIESDNLVYALGDLYQNTVSNLGFRIQIYGEHDYLSQQRVAAQVRTLLFSGIRFALLWRQFGGRSLQFLFAKRSISNRCGELLN